MSEYYCGRKLSLQHSPTVSWKVAPATRKPRNVAKNTSNVPWQDDPCSRIKRLASFRAFDDSTSQLMVIQHISGHVIGPQEEAKLRAANRNPQPMLRYARRMLYSPLNVHMRLLH